MYCFLQRGFLLYWFGKQSSGVQAICMIWILFGDTYSISATLSGETLSGESDEFFAR